MPSRSRLAESDATQVPAAPFEGQPLKQRRSRGQRARRVALIILLVVVLLGGGGLLAGGLYFRSIESGIDRVNAFDAVPEASRPEKVAKDAINILILGSDSRDPENTSGSRTDTIILAHVPRDRSSAQLISIPRDTWVPVPASKDGGPGGRDAKINAAFAWGGIPLMVQTVEQFTRVRVDNVAIIDFAGFEEIIDALGGVELDIERSFTSIHEPHRRFSQGRQQVNGAAALDYARERYAFADGDFARIRHQQQVIKAILDKAASRGLLTNPGRLNAFLKATADAVAVDETLSVFNMATELRGLRSGNLTFLTSPSKGTGRVGTQSVVFADTQKARLLYDAVRRDAVPEILSAGK